MRHGMLTGLLMLLQLGCSGSSHPVQAPAPRQLAANSTVRVWTASRDQLVYRANVRGDTLTGSVLSASGRGDQSRVAISLGDIDSLRIMPGQAAGVFLTGFAIGAFLFWELLVGGF